MTNIITNQIIDPIKVDLKPNHAKYRKYTSTQSLPIYLSFLHYSNRFKSVPLRLIPYQQNIFEYRSTQ